ncbi:hypothetical protein Clacol_006557 [Clathrus columnatus]|uniref:CWF19-like protein 1 n=1 Tax=Clathrus columnatus TaxID=1419009 RepID=A0AAV5ACD9_9AGAM|nr:hypothetical protein Clacol_006557 [Clathrus columnatus]
MSTIKVLVIGSVLGSFKNLCQKIKAIDQKHGKFEIVLASGDFFGPPDNSPERVQELNALLNEEIEVPIQTYITQGQYPIPPSVIEKVQERGQICKNVLLLSKSGILTTSHGLKIASLGGSYLPEKFYAKTSNSESLYQQYFTSMNLKQLVQQVSPSSSSNLNSLAVAKAFASFQFIDILLTYTWPTSIVSETTTLPTDFEPELAPQLDELVRKSKPRYYFSSNMNKFWEREPFLWTEENNRATRFINLGSFGDSSTSQSKKERWFYAFSIAPTQLSSVSQPVLPSTVSRNPFDSENDTKKRPFQTAEGEDDERNKNREAPPDKYPGHYIRDCPQAKPLVNEMGTKKPPEGYVCRACASDQHYIKDCPLAQSGPRERERPRQKLKEIQPDECWFCLSNPNLVKHLLVAIGKECYVTLPKGQIPPTNVPDSTSLAPVPGGGHVLIVPISHFPTLPSIPSDLAPPILSEISDFRAALTSFYAIYNAVPITFEVSRLTAKGGHAHVQIVPVPKRIKHQEIEDAFKRFGEQGQIIWEDITNDDDMDNPDLQKSYFRVELPNGKKLIHFIKPGAPFDVQFGRRVIANILEVPERVDWRICTQSEDDERKDALAFKEAFGAFDPSN